jgi:G:T/U-mismatch repair DNA glycosylase
MTEQEEFEHPYNDVDAVPVGTRTLIVGTCPPHRFCVEAEQIVGDVPFYYGSADNYLWKYIFPKVFGRSVPASREGREAFLKHCKMWMFDIFQRFTRKDQTASDDGLGMVYAGDIGGLLRKCPTIDTICFTGVRAGSETRKKLVDDGLLERYSPWIRTGDMPRRNTLRLKLGRDVVTYTLPSPNGNSERSGYTLDVQVQIYAEVLAKLCHADDSIL